MPLQDDCEEYDDFECSDDYFVIEVECMVCKRKYKIDITESLEYVCTECDEELNKE